MDTEKPLSFHNAPTFYVGFMDNWLAQKKKQGAPPAEVAIVEDLQLLVKVALSVLTPEPTDSATP